MQSCAICIAAFRNEVACTPCSVPQYTRQRRLQSWATRHRLRRQDPRPSVALCRIFPTRPLYPTCWKHRKETLQKHACNMAVQRLEGAQQHQTAPFPRLSRWWSHRICSFSLPSTVTCKRRLDRAGQTNGYVCLQEEITEKPICEEDTT
jgi:hypothetical protein